MGFHRQVSCFGSLAAHSPEPPKQMEVPVGEAGAWLKPRRISLNPLPKIIIYPLENEKVFALSIEVIFFLIYILF